MKKYFLALIISVFMCMVLFPVNAIAVEVKTLPFGDGTVTLSGIVAETTIPVVIEGGEEITTTLYKLSATHAEIRFNGLPEPMFDNGEGLYTFSGGGLGMYYWDEDYGKYCPGVLAMLDLEMLEDGSYGKIYELLGSEWFDPTAADDSISTYYPAAKKDGIFYTFVLEEADATQPVSGSTPEVTVILDGKALSFDVPPQIINDRTMVPLRAIFEEMGATIVWDDATRTVTATKDGTVVKLTIGDVAPTVNGVVVALDQPGIIVDGRTLAPLRFVAEAFGGTVEWDGATRIATISN